MEQAIEQLAAHSLAPESATDLAAFAEFYEMTSLARGGKAPHVDCLKLWRQELRDSRSEAEVRAFMVQKQAEITELVKSGTIKQIAFEQRMIFTGVYGKTSSEEGDILGDGGSPLPLDAVFLLVKEGIRAAESNPVAKTCPLKFRVGTFDERHDQIRKRAFPYTPACGTCEGDDTVDCYGPDGETIVGYIAPRMHSGYIDDLSVLPAWQGRGVAKGLVCKAAEVLAGSGIDKIHLHVRASNYPAIGLYKDCLGFTAGANEFPPWYDWHGGYKMEHTTREVAARMPE